MNEKHDNPDPIENSELVEVGTVTDDTQGGPAGFFPDPGFGWTFN